MSAADRLNEIEARASAATEGPWVYGGKNRIATPVIDVDEADWGGEELSGYAIHAQQDTGAWRYADAEFMAHARTDVPWLIEQVRKRDAALQAALDLHKPVTEGVIVGDCAAEECEHDGDCPEVPIDLCACCYDLARDANPYYGERDVVWVRYPCPTVRVIEAALS